LTSRPPTRQRALTRCPPYPDRHCGVDRRGDLDQEIV
jgi:hypothetical protein